MPLAATTALAAPASLLVVIVVFAAHVGGLVPDNDVVPLFCLST